ncbi:hypothetical protein [Trinickia mobilis]|uniref:hypothetical protein n=1 Tax=Trinickia mobilis TaxID=2816356 RepID=UPI001A8C1264|nr:hypothetical protein [Trinickia mobilis]
MPSLWTECIATVDVERVSIVAFNLPRLRPGRDFCVPISEPHCGEPAAALSALLARVERRAGRARNRLHLLLGYPWAHAAVLPWQEALPNRQAWSAYASSVLSEQGAPGALRVAVEEGGFGRARLAAGVDDSMAALLMAAGTEAGWQVASCGDLLSATLARHAKRLGRDYALALVEPESVSCLYRRNGAWIDAATLMRGAGQPAQTAIDAVTVMCGQTAASPVFICATTPLGGDDFSGAAWIELDAPLAHLVGATPCKS